MAIVFVVNCCIFVCMKKEDMPKNWRQKIHEITGYTITYISYVVLGKRPANTEAAIKILLVAVALAKKHQKEQEEFKTKIETL